MPTKLNAKVGHEVPVQPIVLQKIQEMTDRYRATMTPGDAKSCWVSQAEIEKLLSDNRGANGIRLYYGRHASNEAVDFRNKHNIIMVATKDTIDPPGKLTSENSDDMLDPAENSVIVSFQGQGDDAIPLCPPHCPTIPSVLSPKEPAK